MLTVELVGGGLYIGNVFVNGRPVCDDQWDLTDAGVVCGSLFENGIALEATRESRFGEVEDDFSMDDVQCRGNETSILQCTLG